MKYKDIYTEAPANPDTLSMLGPIAPLAGKWFGDDGFVYDLSYAPAEHTPNYFLLESKRGICSDYASALTLLARAAGLPALPRAHHQAGRARRLP